MYIHTDKALNAVCSVPTSMACVDNQAQMLGQCTTSYRHQCFEDVVRVTCIVCSAPMEKIWMIEGSHTHTHRGCTNQVKSEKTFHTSFRSVYSPLKSDMNANHMTFTSTLENLPSVCLNSPGVWPRAVLRQSCDTHRRHKRRRASNGMTRETPRNTLPMFQPHSHSRLSTNIRTRTVFH